MSYTIQMEKSELVAENSKRRCTEQNIPFFRFNPIIDEIVDHGETDMKKLINMVIKTKIYLKQDEKMFEEIVNLFHVVAESSQDNLEDEPIASIIAEEKENEGPGELTDIITD